MSDTRVRPREDLAGCPCTGGTLDKLIQPAVLAVLAEGPMHGYGLAERIGEMPGFAGQKPDVSGIYRYLKAMEGRSLVVSDWDTSQAGPAKKTYRITPQGQKCLRLWARTLEEHREAITALLSAVRKAAKRS
jgi:PadR family transcriptional regulator, regulatory protein PadR